MKSVYVIGYLSKFLKDKNSLWTWNDLLMLQHYYIHNTTDTYSAQYLVRLLEQTIDFIDSENEKRYIYDTIERLSDIKSPLVKSATKLG